MFWVPAKVLAIHGEGGPEPFAPVKLSVKMEFGGAIGTSCGPIGGSVPSLEAVRAGAVRVRLFAG
jgi:hypothetical protein